MRATSSERYAVVSCHVERPLDDRCWARFAALQRRRPGGLPVAALVRPPDPAHGEQEEPWLERAREAAARAAFGLHTHWTAPDHARPTGGDPGALVRAQLERLRAQGLRPTLFCGGGWYTDEGVAAACAAGGLVDLTVRGRRPPSLPAQGRWAEAAAPVRLALRDGGELLALPTTRSLGDLARALLRGARLPEPLVHVYLHDTDLLDRRRRALAYGLLHALGRIRRPLGLDAAAARFADAPVRAWAEVARGGSAPTGT